MNVVRNAEAVFVGAVAIAFAVAFAGSFYEGAKPGHQAGGTLETRRVARFVSVPSVPVVIVRGKRMTAEEKSRVDPAPAAPPAGARI
ncbi:hypothetical protein ACFFTM_14515 [Pseudoduganella plicata]|uniref:Uncharacterized protein n=1 Tax=Pseudoduganella plicata TaxID=321984 RepID=A0A4P7BBR2_9BURK|nr:hypothetical protein [Pseudoduganella plicata]QBQ34875.1 hypothetical protein E1742_00745 [Pseudoduganella plicata]GGY89243.1 hypothetical protein GCM10007388_23400 [Pseudoduganella plicata]